MTGLTIDLEFHNITPQMLPDDYLQLEENIIKEGCRDAIVTWQGVIVDGHNRYKICTEHNIAYKTIEKCFETKDEAKEWIILNQLGRRNLTLYQRGEMALKLKPLIEARARKNQGMRNDLNIYQNSDECQPGCPNHNKSIDNNLNIYQKSDECFTPVNTLQQLAQIAQVSHDTIHKVETIQNKAPEPVKEAVKNNEISVNKGYQYTKLAARPETENFSQLSDYEEIDRQYDFIKIHASEEIKEKVRTFEISVSQGYELTKQAMVIPGSPPPAGSFNYNPQPELNAGQLPPPVSSPPQSPIGFQQRYSPPLAPPPPQNNANNEWTKARDFINKIENFFLQLYSVRNLSIDFEEIENIAVGINRETVFSENRLEMLNISLERLEKFRDDFKKQMIGKEGAP